MTALIQKYAGWLLLGVLPLVWRCSGDRAQRELGAVRAANAILHDSLVTAKREADSLGRLHFTDTVHLTVTRVRRDTLLRTIDHFLHDTVAVPVEVVREIVRADSAVIQACTVALSSCEAITANLRSRLTMTETQRNNWRKVAQPSWLKRTTETVAKVGIGYLIGKVTP